MEGPLIDAANRLDITNEFLALRSILRLNQVSYAKLFGMSKQALCKLESAMGQARMTFPSILMVSYTLASIIDHPNFSNFSEQQKQAVLNLNRVICEFIKRNKLDDKATNAILRGVY